MVYWLTEEMSNSNWLRCGPVVPLSIEMRLYRWCLTFCELVLNWEDFV
jgi:hypothetical protein